MAVKYEPVVTLGNLLTALTIAVGGITAWTSMARQVEHNSARIDSVMEVNARQDIEVREGRAEIRSQIRDVQSDIKELTLAIGRNSINSAASGKK